MMFTGRIVDGPESVRLGLVNECVLDGELAARAAELAATIAANSWYTLRAGEWLVNEEERYTLADGLASERASRSGATPDTIKRLKESGSRRKS
jgi:enoyl-CoA hydratase/carnithine racemase